MDKWPPMVSKVHASGQIGTIILQGPPTFPWDFARPSMQGHSQGKPIQSHSICVALGAIFITYSQVPYKRVGPNKRVGWLF